jgi:hypothetical protein
MTTFDFLRMPSPVGELLIVCTAQAVHFLDYSDYEARMHSLLRARYDSAYTCADAQFVAGSLRQRVYLARCR